MKRLSATDLRTRLGDLALSLCRHTPLADGDQAAIRGQWRAVSRYPSGVGVGSIDGIRFLLSGWACRLRRTDSGRRQIFMFLVPGDVIGSIRDWRVDDRFEIACLTPVELVDVTALVAPAEASPYPAVAKAAMTAERRAEAILMEHIMRLGAMTAREGLAHLLLELHGRLAEVNMADGDWFPLPVGQRPLGHAMGLSVMHVNATLKYLRAEAIIELGVGWARIIDRARLCALASARAVQLATLADEPPSQRRSGRSARG